MIRTALAASTLILLPVFTIACSESGGNESTDAARSGPLVVQAVNYPLTYFAQRIGGDHVDARFLAPADGDPAFWHPTDADVAALQAADLILLNGAAYATWRNQVSLPESRTVHTGYAFTGSLIVVEEAGTHSHGADGEHSHSGFAFTTWLDMRQARQHADAVRDALIVLMPDAEDDIEANAAATFADLDRLDAELEAVAATIGDRPLVASHPIYQYLARRYGLAIEAVFWEPEAVPDDAAMAYLQTVLAAHPATWMIWEGDPASASVAKLDAIGVRSLVFDPCGNRPDEGDWLSVMEANVENLEAAGG